MSSLPSLRRDKTPSERSTSCAIERTLSTSSRHRTGTSYREIMGILCREKEFWKREFNEESGCGAGSSMKGEASAWPSRWTMALRLPADDGRPEGDDGKGVVETTQARMRPTSKRLHNGGMSLFHFVMMIPNRWGRRFVEVVSLPIHLWS
ncbi:hypothetical protein SCHPADRAFT_739186 [Schizopora paradoxa]|uniref:Uncharacterized protein n=1 Tax=Schizopora paradoxa TaxID=27342 RepID=A0A0H2R032_9AGAM|nr:hypothetical protein SCHPADRAFT_739186 [Schizopora paradoxa]